jgi:hypothetical protein
MRLRIAIGVVGLAASLTALAETAVTNKETELKKEPATDAATLATLPTKTSVDVLKRQGGWYQVKPASAVPGWIRMLNLDLGGGGSKESGGGGLGAVFNVARTGSSGATTTTGIGGGDKINADTIRNSNPDMNELKRMHSYTASKADALKFASNAGLRKQSVEYMAAGSSNSSSEKPKGIFGE